MFDNDYESVSLGIIIFLVILSIILFLGGITMFVVGILGAIGVISGIALGGSITMIVLGTILGLVPLLRKLF